MYLYITFLCHDALQQRMLEKQPMLLTHGIHVEYSLFKGEIIHSFSCSILFLLQIFYYCKNTWFFLLYIIYVTTNLLFMSSIS